MKRDAVYSRSYSTRTNTYSKFYTTVEHHIIEDGELIYTSDYERMRVPREDVYGRYVNIMIPTKYDQDGYVWKHEGETGQYVIATMVYNDQAANVRVKIPWIGYQSVSVNLDGVEFFLRTGPNKFSVKCDQEENKFYNFTFSYDIVNEKDSIMNMVHFSGE